MSTHMRRTFRLAPLPRRGILIRDTCHDTTHRGAAGWRGDTTNGPGSSQHVAGGFLPMAVGEGLGEARAPLPRTGRAATRRTHPTAGFAAGCHRRSVVSGGGRGASPLPTLMAMGTGKAHRSPDRFSDSLAGFRRQQAGKDSGATEWPLVDSAGGARGIRAVSPPACPARHALARITPSRCELRGRRACRSTRGTASPSPPATPPPPHTAAPVQATGRRNTARASSPCACGRPQRQ